MHNCPVPIIGLTGGIASGKTTVAQVLQDKGFKVINADKLIKAIYAEETTISYVKKNWPGTIKDDAIDFQSLRKLFFGNKKIQENLEGFLYKEMPQKFLSQVSASDEFIIYDIPLLFEKKLDQLVDLSVCVYCNPEDQIARLIKRDKIDEELAVKIIESQISIEKKSQLADYVIDNNSEHKALAHNVEDFIQKVISS